MPDSEKLRTEWSEGVRDKTVVKSVKREEGRSDGSSDDDDDKEGFLQRRSSL